MTDIRRLSNFVEGKAHTSLDATRITAVVDPSTGEAYAEVPVSGSADLDAAFSTATAAQPQWGDRTPGQRSRALLRVADAVESRAVEFVAEECRNTGKPRTSMTVDEMPHIVDVIRFFAGRRGCWRDARRASTSTGTRLRFGVNRWG